VICIPTLIPAGACATAGAAIISPTAVKAINRILLFPSSQISEFGRLHSNFRLIVN
jgi:hypothetical protein